MSRTSQVIDRMPLTVRVAMAIRIKLAWQRIDVADLADAISEHPMNLVNKLSGVEPFTLDEVDRIAQTLGVDPGSLLRPSLPKTRVLTGYDDRGLVYFAENAEGQIKIGHTKDLKNRLRGLKSQLGAEPAVLGVLRGRTRSCESALHRLFADDRLHGEWFRPSVDLLHFITQHAEAAA